VSREDWYRNEEWNEEIKEAFFVKLKRARRKEQYLRIQASIIAPIYPDVALTLLKQYFTLDDKFDHAQAYCDMATAYLTQSKISEALDSYTYALEREKEYPNLKTDAYILYPLTIVENKLRHMYQSADLVLESHKRRLLFPIDHFRWHAAKAIVEYNSGKNDIASAHASIALDAAKIKKSGFRFHQKLGLVGKEFHGIVKELQVIYR